MSRKPTTLPASNKNKKKLIKTIKLTPCSDTDVLEPPTKKPCAGFSLSNPPIFDLTRDDVVLPSSQGSAVSRSTLSNVQSQLPSDFKGKSRENVVQMNDVDDRLWVDKYEPKTEAELAVHKRKVEDVRRWLLEAFEGGPSGKLRKYRRVLSLTGPAGTAKTATLRVLARELEVEILEWRNSMNERARPHALVDTESWPDGELLDTETLFDKFQAFLMRATTCKSVVGTFSTERARKRQLVLLEDLPNLLHAPTRARFQDALRSLCFSSSNPSDPSGPPIVIILSDSGLRAEQPDDDTWDGSGRQWNKKEALDIRHILGPELLTSHYVTCIGFNPIAPTLLTKALQALLASHFGSLNPVGKQPTREVIDLIVESSNGDIRSAIMALQFTCVVDLPSAKGKVSRRNKKTTTVRAVLEAVTRREQSLVLFHLMGKILYNKRKFDPPASHLSAKEATKDRELDLQLVNPTPLPAWLSHHDRKASRVCIETLVAESPIDSSLLGMYTHQNYTLFCTDVDQCDGVGEGLSWVDCMGGVLSTNSPYAFPTLTMSTLHALPTPVPRRGQKVCKPAWFDVRTRELEAWDAIGDVVGWLGRDIHIGDDIDDSATSSASVGKWTHSIVATELGGLLRALDRCSFGTAGANEGHRLQPPRTHRLFSHLPWDVGSGNVHVLGENEDGDGDELDEDVRLPGGGMRGGEERKGWLEEDDIEEVQ